VSGQENFQDMKLFIQHLTGQEVLPDLIFDAGKCRRRQASRLVDLRNDLKPVILRP
jgi:tRNA A37 threonylcarbamoyladenosine synthetase subunit TsaC/SUA5/YrdC